MIKDFYFKDHYLVSITLQNPFKTMKQLKGVFIPLICKFWFGRRENIPLFFYNRGAKIFSIQCCDVLWKDKFKTPRLEESPFILITIFNYAFLWKWGLCPHLLEQIDDYWEQALWYLYYCQKHIVKAKKKWPWSKVSSFNDNGESTWKDKFLTNKTKSLIQNNV